MRTSKKSKKQSNQFVSSPSSIDKSVLYMIYRITNALTDDARKRLRHLDINISKWRVLTILAAKGKHTVGEISKYTVMQQPVISRITSDLEAEGLIERGPITNDQRFVTIKLSRAGQALMKKIIPIRDAHYQMVLNGFTDKELSDLSSYLLRLQHNLDIKL